MPLSVGDIVEATVTSPDNGSSCSVLGVVVEPWSGQLGAKLVRVMVGAEVQGPQIVSVNDARLVARGVAIPWVGTDTHAMLNALLVNQRAPKPPMPPPTRAVPQGSGSGGIAAAGLPPLRVAGRLPDERTPLPVVSASGSLPPRPPAPVAGARLPEPVACPSPPPPPPAPPGGNLLNGVCAAVDVALFGPDLRQPVASFALLALWITTGTAAGGGVAVAMAQLSIGVGGLFLFASIIPAIEKMSAPPSTTALSRLVLLLLAVSGCGGLLVNTLLVAALLLCSAMAFDQREKAAADSNIM